MTTCLCFELCRELYLVEEFQEIRCFPTTLENGKWQIGSSWGRLQVFVRLGKAGHLFFLVTAVSYPKEDVPASIQQKDIVVIEQGPFDFVLNDGRSRTPTHFLSLGHVYDLVVVGDAIEGGRKFLNAFVTIFGRTNLTIRAQLFPEFLGIGIGILALFQGDGRTLGTHFF